VRQQTTINGRVGDVVSLIPLRGDVPMVRTTTGLQWPLVTAETLQFGQARGISNRMTAVSATVEISSGILLCVHTVAGWLVVWSLANLQPPAPKTKETTTAVADHHE
jgi:thiamine pyrophosphokinase